MTRDTELETSTKKRSIISSMPQNTIWREEVSPKRANLRRKKRCMYAGGRQAGVRAGEESGEETETRSLCATQLLPRSELTASPHFLAPSLGLGSPGAAPTPCKPRDPHGPSLSAPSHPIKLMLVHSPTNTEKHFWLLASLKLQRCTILP